MNFIETFQQMLVQNRLPHVLLFKGPKGSQKASVALACAQKLLQTEQEKHVDLHHYYPEGKTGMHSIQVVKHLCKDIYLSAHEGGYKCFIVHDAERMLPSNANALLKTFEEPPEKSVIFLLTTRPAMILPTILSRCQSYSFTKVDNEQAKDAAEKKLLEILSHKRSLLHLSSLCEQLEKERKKKESEGAKKLPKDITAVQRESLQKEIEGSAYLEYQERAMHLFETVQRFYHDLALYHLKVPSERLSFPDLSENYDKLPPKNLDHLDEALHKARLAHDRGLKLQYCLESLII